MCLLGKNNTQTNAVNVEHVEKLHIPPKVQLSGVKAFKNERLLSNINVVNEKLRNAKDIATRPMEIS